MSINKQIEELAEEILQEYTNCYSEVDKEVLAKMICKALPKQSEGEWIVSKTEQAWNNGEYPIERACSVCGLRRNIETQVAWNFCPNCGNKRG